MRASTIGRATLVLGDSRELCGLVDQAVAVISDPPYGIGYVVRSRRGRGSLDWHQKPETPGRGMIIGDDQAFDPAPWLQAPRVAFFGANHFCDRLPPGGRWIVWDKRRDSKPDNHPDCELVWTNVPGADRIHRQKWRGIVREGEENVARSRKLHPNQKPVALMTFLLEQLAVPVDGLVLDPFMGSGSTGIAALRRGGRFIGIEKDPAFYAVAVERFQREVERAI